MSDNGVQPRKGSYFILYASLFFFFIVIVMIVVYNKNFQLTF